MTEVKEAHKKKVLIIDDEEDLCVLAAYALTANRSDLEVISAKDGPSGLERAKAEQPAAIVLDINMPGKDGFEVLRQMRHDRLKPAVLVLSIHPEDQLGTRVFKEGASGFLNKDAAPQELAGAIRTVHAGRKYVSPHLAEKLASALQNITQGPPHEFLTNREYRVLCMIAAGKSVQDIADEMSISVHTVRTYRDRIFRKMNMRNIAELTRYAIEHKLL